MESQLRMELYSLRHGESIKNAGQGKGSKSKNGNPRLTENGKMEITRIAKSIKKFKITFDIILTSPLSSATQTAKIISSISKMKGNTVNCGELLPEGNSLELYNRLQDFALESSILIVGHESYLTNIIDDIISQQRSKGIRSRLVTNGTRMKDIGRPERSIGVKRGGLAKIRIISITPELREELRWLLTPRILKSLFGESYTVEKTRQKKGKSGD